MGRAEIYDAIVVGLGGVGSFALRSLARMSAESGIKARATTAAKYTRVTSSPVENSLRVLGLDRYQIGHELGSSRGGTRLFRHAYFEHANYVPLCVHSTKIFQELSDWKAKVSSSATIPLLERCGVLVVSDGGRDDYGIINKCQVAAEEFKIPVEILDAKELGERFGNMLQITNEMRGILEPGAGFVRPELAVQYAIEDAVHHGAQIIENTVVTSIHKSKETENDNESGDDIIAVETKDGERFLTRGVILSAGAWASKLVPEWEEHLTVTRQIQAWYETERVANDPHITDHNSTSPGWYLDRAKDEIPIYGIPADPSSSDRPTQAKIALHGRNDPLDPDQDRPDVTDDELQELRDVVQDWIPALGLKSSRDITTSNSKACLYTMTSDGHFIVDRVPYHRQDRVPNRTSDINMWCVAGLSGHGFKMTPALGEAAADLVMNGKTDLPVGFLSAKRFSK